MTTVGARSVDVLRFDGSRCTGVRDDVACEEPLEIRVRDARTLAGPAKPLSVTMRTPGHDLELAIGFMLSEGIVKSIDDIARIDQGDGTLCDDATKNLVTVTLAPGRRLPSLSMARHFFATSSCGVCGKASIEALRALLPTRVASGPSTPRPPTIRVACETLLGLAPKLRAAQAVFARTGGLHATALFDMHGTLQRVREDVGRHNAFDKIVGASLSARDTLARSIALVSGRVSFELVQKALMADIPMLVAIGAPSSLAVELATDGGLTLVGFLREGRFNVYSGRERILIPEEGLG